MTACSSTWSGIAYVSFIARWSGWPDVESLQFVANAHHSTPKLLDNYRQGHRILEGTVGEVLRSHPVGALMLPFLILFGAGLCGYVLAPAYCWLAAALGLISVSWARHFVLVRRGVEAGLDDFVGEALLRSSLNALVVTGACYWMGVVVRSASSW